ncbi:hypothetical protein Pcinc_018902 [Petrolisthes cinctipes]|uniref:Uncharacterized protein n=1 Tax=Petrolisthes cinctipes TaxID=88211 RepID=A0AAE1KNA4_PETCI|nr:hypothetical protein Pcinc_018902 [Petrolisthes cinctipes]
MSLVRLLSVGRSRLWGALRCISWILCRLSASFLGGGGVQSQQDKGPPPPPLRTLHAALASSPSLPFPLLTDQSSYVINQQIKSLQISFLPFQRSRAPGDDPHPPPAQKYSNKQLIREVGMPEIRCRDRQKWMCCFFSSSHSS